MSTASLLIELGCEDLPARFVQALSEALSKGIVAGLDTAQITHGAPRSFATPRRIAVLIDAVADTQPEQKVARQGPALNAALRDGQPTPAGLGFARSCGVEFSQLEQRETAKGVYLHFSKTAPGQALSALLPEIMAQTVKDMDRLVPKRMRWGSGDETFVRPAQWLCALHGETVLDLQALGLHSQRNTRGHRFHSPGEIELADAADYAEALLKAHVLADFQARRQAIVTQIKALEAKLGGQVQIDATLLDEVTALVEWPVAISGSFDRRYLAVPTEAIVLTIQDHQRYFPVFDSAGALLPLFVTVSNVDSKDMAQVIAGNERVVRPRLDDALFFWEQDLKRPLEDRLPELERITWAKGLGSLRDKATRLEAICAGLAPAFGLEPALAAQAGRLAKCDLVTQAVFEMPELQGVMGGHYLRAAQPSPSQLADAVAEHYRPAGPSEEVPGTALGQLLALADKLDTLRGYFSIDAFPTASKDPFALRRSALGLLRILLEGSHALSGAQLLDGPGFKLSPAQRGKLVEFLHERLRGLLSEGGLPAQVVSAVLASAQGPVDARNRATAVAQFMQTPAGAALAATSKRARNILRDAGAEADASVQTAVLAEPAEQQLWAAIDACPAQEQASGADYSAALASLAGLQPAIDAFFDGVMVNADESALRQNRLALLQAFDRACGEVADFAILASGST